MIAYAYDENGYYIGEKNCQLDPLESKRRGKKVYLLPAHATWDKPLKEKDGYRVKYAGGAWIYEKNSEQQPEPEPEPTEDEKKVKIRAIRDYYLNSIEWRVSRYRDQTELGIETSDSQEEYMNILEYMQYLRDYPTSSSDWFENEPLTYEDWRSEK